MDLGYLEILSSALLAGIAYLVISNFFWVFLGSRFLQSLPGVSDKSLLGTVKISLMFLSILVGTFIWIGKRMILQDLNFKDQVSESLKFSSSIIQKLKFKINSIKAKNK